MVALFLLPLPLLLLSCIDLGESLVQIERRHWVRLPLTIPVFVRRTYPNGQESIEFATALNVSAGGVLLASRRDIDCGEMVSLEVPKQIGQLQLSEIRTLFKAVTVRSIRTRDYFLIAMQFQPPLL